MLLCCCRLSALRTAQPATAHVDLCALAGLMQRQRYERLTSAGAPWFSRSPAAHKACHRSGRQAAVADLRLVQLNLNLQETSKTQ